VDRQMLYYILFVKVLHKVAVIWLAFFLRIGKKGSVKLIPDTCLTHYGFMLDQPIIRLFWS